MATPLVDFLIDLSKDPFKCEQFKSDPQRFMKEAELEDAEAAVLIAGDEDAIGSTLARKKKKATKKTKKNSKVLRIPTDLPEVN
jgi:hypothetical protein